MSATRQRIASAVRNLALTPEERRALLGDSKNKGGKASSAGVGTSEAEESRLCCDGSTSGSANPGTGERDPDADGAGQDGLDPNDPANLSSGDGTLSGVTDCATGEPICFDGSGFIPPDGWEEPNEPPLEESYTEGRFWYASQSSGGSSTIVCPAAIVQASYECWLANGSRNPDDYELKRSSDTLYYAEYLPNGGVGIYFVSVGCNGSSASYCSPTDDEIMADAWPSDGCTNLAIVNGKIIGSKYDPDQDGSYSAPRDSIDLCDPENGARITLRASGQSDWKTIDAINGGDGYLYSGGKQIARISGDEFTDPNV